MPVSSSCRNSYSLCSILFAVLVVLLSSLVAPSKTLAQTELAGVYGRVTDESGAVIADAEVEIKNVETNQSLTVKTNPDGLYTIPSLHPGHYLISARKPGFKTVTVTELTLNVQDNVIRNFILQVGSIAETVTVRAEDLHINTTDATVSTVVDRRFVENAPLNGRSFQTLIQLTPGSVVTAANLSDGGQFSINGQRPSANYWMVDGVSANIGINSGLNPGNGMGGSLGSFTATGGTNSLVSVDALQEFRIQTSTYAPEFGRTPGGQISIVTRSGTNQFHGTVFDYLRNDVLDASDWFNGFKNNPPLPKAKDRQNDFGGTLGGPIFKDRTFFFFSYEGLRLRLPQTSLTTVPDLAARQNAIPAMRPFLNAFPLPNGPDNTTTGVAQFGTSFSNQASLDAYSLRVDHKVRSGLSLFARYNYSPSELINRGGSGISPMSVVQPSKIKTQTGTVGSTWVITSRAVNDLRFNYSRTNASSRQFLDSFGGAVPLTALPFPDSFTSENAFFNFVLFPLTTNGRQLNVGPVVSNLQRQINVVESLSFQSGSHTMKFGADFRRLAPVSKPPLYVQNPTFLDMAAALTGTTFVPSIRASRERSLLTHDVGVFAQDTWRIVPRLMLTYGLRWDVDAAPSAEGTSIPAVTGFNLSDLSQLAIAPAGTAPFQTTYSNIAPRIGVAYQISDSRDWSTVIRGGFGVFYDLVNSETGSLISAGFPPFAFSVNLARGTPFPFNAAQAAAPAIPSGGVLAQVYAFNPNLKLPYTLEWNTALEQGLGRAQTLSLSYLGAAGRRLLQTTQFSRPSSNSAITNAELVDNTATSDYHALQAQFRRRLARGLEGQAAYTWSHSIDTASAGSTALNSNDNIPGKSNVNRGPSDFDIRHSFSGGFTYEIPSPGVNIFAKTILSNWALQSLIFARTAPPVDVSDLLVSFLPGGVFPGFVRPDIVTGQPLYLFGRQYPGGKAFNPAAFQNPPTSGGVATRQGNVPRNFLRGFGAAQWDCAVRRDFPIHEMVRLQFRAEIFNLLNHPNFGPPNGQFFSGSTTFGISTQMLAKSLSGFAAAGNGGFNPLYQVGGPRSVQLALKLQF